MKRFLAALITAVVMIAGIWYIALPADTIEGILGNSLGESGLTIESTGFRKGSFYDIEADGMTLEKSGRPLLAAQNVTAGIDFASLFSLKPALRFGGNSAGGKIEGCIGLFGGGGRTEVRITDARMENLPLFASLGIGGSGRVSGDMRLANGIGEILFSLSDARLKPAAFGAITLPLDVFTSGRGAFSIAGNTITVKSFALEGDGVYARLRGRITGNVMNLTLEVMPQRRFVEKNPVFTLLASYKDSPGHYSIPVRGPVNF